MSVSDTLQNDKGQRRALKSLLDGSAPAMASKQDATLAPNALGPGSVERSVVDLLGKSLRNKRLIPPSSLLGTLPFNVLTSGNGDYYTDFDWGNFVSGTVMYLNKQVGNDSNNGLTPTTPKKSIRNALANGGRVIYVSGGTIPYSNADTLWSTIVWPDADVAIIGTGPRPIFLYGDLIASWSAVGGHANVYSATVTAPVNVIDFSTLDARGNPTPLTPRADLTALDAASEGYFISGTTVNVKLTDLSNPASNRVGVSRTTEIMPAHAVAGRSVYLQNMAFIGDRPFRMTSADGATQDHNKKIVTVDCLFGYCNRTDDAFSANFINMCASFRSIATYSDVDGFDYHNIDTTIDPEDRMLVLEENCVSYGAGWGDGVDGPNQATTAHEGCRVVRVGGQYLNAGGPIIQDQAGTGIQCASWQVGCTLDTSRASQGSGNSLGLYGVNYDTYAFDCVIKGTLGDVIHTTLVDRCRVTTMQGSRCTPYRQGVE